MSNVLSDFVIGFAKQIASSIETSTGTTLVNLAAPGSHDPDEEADDAAGDVIQKVDSFGQPGVLFRGLDPETDSDGNEDYVEWFFVRTADGAIPVAGRDLRLDAAFPSGMAKGQVALVGYGGGFHSLSRTPTDSGDQRATIHTIYAPYEFTDGVPAKAHAVVLDTTPGNLAVTMTNGEGSFVQCSEDNILMSSPDGSTWMRIEDGKITLSAVEIVLSGGTIVGEPALAVPMLPGPASPGSTKFYLSP